ncbi:M23 family metallopeptidase [Pseudogemmobacter sp. W21_MBD1_M6]|uniref:M23 family metallopeptidase n=1 Tax=Pseudogemmobacter sp. W21_MBD1_M6 TaxID=3240271 RepID=UPI003F98A16C
MIRGFLSLILITFAAPLAAKDFLIDLPIDCTLGENCYIQQYTDQDPTEGAQDFTCGALTYDGHKGTDFALTTLADMQAGVDVLAAAAGVVMATRDQVPDVAFGTAGAPDVSRIECGNGLAINHGDGWETQYCHMKLGSLIVEKGQRVTKGAVLGEVGLSGRTQFPHVHLSVRRNGQIVDPFAPDSLSTCGTQPPASMWQTDIPYSAGGIVSVGLSTAVPSYDDVKAGLAGRDVLPIDAPALVVWGFAYGGQQGDTMDLSINGPKGEIVNQSIVLPRIQAQFFRAVGKPLKADGWPAGPYTGEARLTRNGAILSVRRVTIRVEG